MGREGKKKKKKEKKEDRERGREGGKEEKKREEEGGNGETKRREVEGKRVWRKKKMRMIIVVVRGVERRLSIICVLLVVAFSVLLERKILGLSQNRSGPIINR